MANFYTDNPDLKFQLSHPLMDRIVNLREDGFKDYGVYDYAPENTADALDSYDKVMEVFGEICADVLDTNAAEVDAIGAKCENGKVTYAPGTVENQKALIDAGMYGMSLPRQYGGLNFSIVPYIMAAELTARADASFSNIWGLQDCAETINEFASQEIRDEFLPRIPNGASCSMDLTEPDAGSDLQSVTLRADWSEEKQMWLLNGVKRFITNGNADIKLVLARSEEGTKDGRGLSYFVHDRAWGGVTVRRIENKLGIKGSPTCELAFKDAPAKIVGERKLGLIKYVMSLMNGARLGIGAQSVGISEAAYRTALKYANEREQFGHKIIEFAPVYQMLSNMKARLQASRAALYETGRYVDIYKSLAAKMERTKLSPEEKSEYKQYSKKADMLTPILKMFSSEYCNRDAYDAIQIHGGSGYMKEYPAERLYRDARITSIYEGTSQLQVIAAIRYVTTGAYSALIKEYDESVCRTVSEMRNGELDSKSKDGLLSNIGFISEIREKLVKCTEQFAQVLEFCNGKDKEFIDYHSRSLVEMAGNLLLSYLLLLEAVRNADMMLSARLYSTQTVAENQKHASMIMSLDLDGINAIKLNYNK